MNPILESLTRRKSVRAFTEKPVSPEQKRILLESAAQAPTAGNQQLYTILDITDPALKAALSESCDHQSMIARAPVVLIFCADCRKWYDAYVEAGGTPHQPGPGDLLLAVDDALIAAQNAVVAAESLGLGSCYIGDIMEQYEIHRNLLDLPQWVFPAAMLIVGFPTEQQQTRPKPKRADLSYLVHENTYHTLDGNALRTLFSGRIGEQDFETWMKAFCARKYNSAFSLEMNRSVIKYLQDFAVGFSTDDHSH